MVAGFNVASIGDVCAPVTPAIRLSSNDASAAQAAAAAAAMNSAPVLHFASIRTPATKGPMIEPTRPIVLTERSDTTTENALMAAALHPGTTIIRNASSNYMVQDLCFFLQKLGVDVEGVGTTTLTVTGRDEIEVDVDYAPAEDPIEAMSLLAAAIVTESEITIRRARRDDVGIIIKMLADDPLGGGRERLEDPLPAAVERGLEGQVLVRRDVRDQAGVQRLERGQRHRLQA